MSDKPISDEPAEAEALGWAIEFHVEYERRAAEFDYVTRTDTQIFDPESRNGKLMIAVCRAVVGRALQDARMERERIVLDLQCLHDLAQRIAPAETWGQNVCAWAASTLASTIGERDEANEYTAVVIRERDAADAALLAFHGAYVGESMLHLSDASIEAIEAARARQKWDAE